MTAHLWRWILWIFPNGETLATWGLVIAGFIQLRAIRKNSQAQTERWKREDSLRAEQDKPRFRFGLQGVGHATSLELWCANLGKTSFILHEIHLRRVRDRKLISIPIRQIVRVGKQRNPLIPYDKIKFLDGVDFEAWIKIDGFEGIPASDEILTYKLLCSGGEIVALKKGCWELRHIGCSRCGRAYGYFPEGEAENVMQLAPLMKKAQLIVDATCPSHAEKTLHCGAGKIERAQTVPMPSPMA